MGATCYSCQGYEKEQDLIKILRTALNFSKILIQTSNLNKLNEIINTRSTQLFHFYECTVQLKCEQYSGTQQKRCSLQRLVVTPNQSNNSIIVYKDGFYIGKNQSGKANDEMGSLYLLSEHGDVKYILRGKWRNDQFKEGVLAQLNKQQKSGQKKIFSIKWNFESNKFKIRFNYAQNQNITQNNSQIASYQGTINTKGTTLMQILNGSGLITFRDGSTYDGAIKDGLMHTYGVAQQAIFSTADRQEVYQGHYKEGFRHGYGSLVVDYQGSLCKFTMKWENGVPAIDTLKLQSRYFSRMQKEKTQF